jgi:N-methylhydantoinase A
VPGPACYGRGGDRPTVADADLVLGYLNPDNFLGGRLQLDVERAREAIATHVAEPLGLEVEAAAEGIKTIVDARMADLIRTATIQQGYDPADFVLYAYGGAGPTHAFAYGAELGIDRVVVPLTASVHSAFGIAASDLTTAEELSDPLLSPPGTDDYSQALDAREIEARFERLTARARERLGVEQLEFTRSIEMRFRFQIHVLTVPVAGGAIDVNDVVRRFIETYEARFGEGSAFSAAGVEMTTFRVVARAPSRTPALAAVPPANGAAPEQRRLFSDGQWKTAQVLREAGAGLELDGLAIIERPDTTIVIGDGQHATVDEHGNVIIEVRP